MPIVEIDRRTNAQRPVPEAVVLDASSVGTRKVIESPERSYYLLEGNEVRGEKRVYVGKLGLGEQTISPTESVQVIEEGTPAYKIWLDEHIAAAKAGRVPRRIGSLQKLGSI